MPFVPNEHEDNTVGETFVTWEWQGFLVYADNDLQSLAIKQRFGDKDSAVEAAIEYVASTKESVRVCEEEWPLAPGYEPSDVSPTDIPPGEPFDFDCLSSNVVETIHPEDFEG